MLIYDQFRTPPFMPEARKKPIGLGVGQPGGAAIPGAGGITEEPPMPAPAMRAPIRSMALPERQSPQGPVGLSTQAPAMGLQRPTLQQQMIPQLPGRGGGMVPDNPYDTSKYDYVMRGAKRNPDNTFAGDSDRVEFKRSGKDIGTAALLGLKSGGLPGAIIGGLTGALNPQLAREQNFDSLYGGRIQADQARRAEAAGMEAKQRREAIGLEQEQAQTELLKAQALRAGQPAQPKYQLENGIFYDPANPQGAFLAPQAPRVATPKLEAMVGADGQGTLIDMNDPANIGKSYSPYQRPQGYGEQVRESDADVESQYNLPQIIQDSVAGDPEGVKRYMPEKLYNIVTNGGRTGRTIDEYDAQGKPTGRQVPEMASDEDIADAQQAYIGAQQRLLKEKTDGAKANLRGEQIQRRAGLGRGGAKTQGLGQTAPQQAAPAKATSLQSPKQGAKGSIGSGFIGVVAQKYGITPEEARKRIEADGYTIQ